MRHVVGFAVVAALMAVVCGSSPGQEVMRPRNRTLPGATPAIGSSENSAMRASCVLQIDADLNRGTRFDSQALNAMLTSTALVDPAAQKALGLAADVWPKVAQVELLPAGSSAVKLSVTISPNGEIKLPPEPAKALLTELATRAKAAVEDVGSQSDKANVGKREAMEKDLAAAKTKLQAAETALRQVRSEAGMDVSTGRSTQSSLVFEKQTLELSLAGQKARLKAIEAVRSTIKPTSRPSITDAATELVALRQLACDHTAELLAQGKAGNADVLEAKIKLVEAKLTAATVRDDTTRGTFDDRWFSEIITLTGSIAESEARLAIVGERLAKLQASPTGGADINTLSMDEQRARQECNDLTMQLDALRRQSRAGGGTRLLILDGSTPAQP